MKYKLPWLSYIVGILALLSTLNANANSTASRQPNVKEVKLLTRLHQCEIPLNKKSNNLLTTKATSTLIRFTPINQRNTLTQIEISLKLWGIPFSQLSIVGGEHFIGVGASAKQIDINSVIKQLNRRGYAMIADAPNVKHSAISTYQSTRYVGGIRNRVTVINAVLDADLDDFTPGVSVSCTTDNS
jgi:hypothetical protein